jgi:hypothetical protein
MYMAIKNLKCPVKIYSVKLTVFQVLILAFSSTGKSIPGTSGCYFLIPLVNFLIAFCIDCSGSMML